MYVNLELCRDSMIEVKCGAHEAISTALKRCARLRRAGSGARLAPESAKLVCSGSTAKLCKLCKFR